MDQHNLDATSTRGFLITFGLWMLANVTASQFATYCTIISAILTIVINIKKLINGKNKH